VDILTTGTRAVPSGSACSPRAVSPHPAG